MKYSRSTDDFAPIREEYGSDPASTMGDVANDENSDRSHWNLRYTERPWPHEPSRWLVESAGLLPPPGSALDVAGGTGRNGLWLARRGWAVTIADVSNVALTQALERADREHLEIDTLLTDLSMDPFPAGPWNLIAFFHYLDRGLFPIITEALAPGGVLIGSLATFTNLERNARPPAAYLLEDGELPDLIEDLELVSYAEGWQDDHHDARFVARRPV